ncbi:hypothetical protein D9M71_584060 [compost metagenome]
MPSRPASTANRLIPLSLVLPGVRAATINKPAQSPSITWPNRPSTTKPSPSALAVAWISSAPQPLPRVNARVAVRRPSAMGASQVFFCASSAVISKAGVARQAVAKNGEQNNRRPICSSRMFSSTKPRPRPP